MTTRTTALGDALTRSARGLDKPAFARFLATLTEPAKDQMELSYRANFLAKINRDAAVAGSSRTVREVDSLDTLEAIERRFGVAHVWDISAADAQTQKEIDDLLAMPSPNVARDARLLKDAGIDLGDSETRDEALTDPVAFVERIQREADQRDRADLAKLTAASETKPGELERDVLEAEIKRLETLPKSRRY
jgi:hypothetical protein